MGHNLLIRNGKASMFYVGAEPWHGLSEPLKSPPSAEKAIRAAGLDWAVVKAPLYMFAQNRLIQAKGRYALVPEDQAGRDDCPVFGVVADGYKPLQNAEAFSFFDPVIETGAVAYETAGALGQGERIWVLARLDGDMEVAGVDKVRRYLLLANSHDGESSIQIKFTPTRVVCQNTLTLALSEGRGIRVAHRRSMASRLEEAQRLLGFLNTRFGRIERRFNEMVSMRLDRRSVEQYVQGVFPNPKDKHDEAAQKRVVKDREWAEYFYKHGKGNEERPVAGTLWAAYNGVTEYIDHSDRRPTSTPESDARRLPSIWFGDGYQTKARAFQVADEMLPPPKEPSMLKFV